MSVKTNAPGGTEPSPARGDFTTPTVGSIPRDARARNSLVDLAAIPADLRQRRQWVAWRRERQNGRDAKVPYSADGRRASVSNAETWCSFDEAANCYVKRGYAGIGFVLTARDPFAVVDLDHVLQDGALTPDAAALVQSLDSYTEITPSGGGIHVWIRARLAGPARRAHGVETYDRRHFMSLTGWRLPGTRDQIGRRQAEVDGLLGNAPDPVPARAGLTDDEILARAMRAENAEKFARLWEGRWRGFYKSQSEADLALLAILCFWTRKNRDQIDRLFRRSALMRAKWDSQYKTTTGRLVQYGRHTTLRAIASARAVWQPGCGTPERRAILAVLQASDRPLRACQIARATETAYDATLKTLRRMLRAGAVRRERGGYSA